MKKSLLTLALLASLCGVTTAKATNSNIFDYPTLLGSSDLYLDINVFDYYSSKVSSYGAVQVDNLVVDDEGARLGIKKYFASNTDSNYAPFIGASVFMSYLELKQKHSCPHPDCKHYYSNLVTTNGFGLEAGVMNTSFDPLVLFASLDISQSTASYKALGLGFNLGMGLKMGNSNILYLGLQMKRFGKGTWTRNQDFDPVDTYKYKPLESKGLTSYTANAIYLGISF